MFEMTEEVYAVRNAKPIGLREKSRKLVSGARDLQVAANALRMQQRDGIQQSVDAFLKRQSTNIKDRNRTSAGESDLPAFRWAPAPGRYGGQPE